MLKFCGTTFVETAVYVKGKRSMRRNGPRQLQIILGLVHEAGNVANDSIINGNKKPRYERNNFSFRF